MLRTTGAAKKSAHLSCTLSADYESLGTRFVDPACCRIVIDSRIPGFATGGLPMLNSLQRRLKARVNLEQLEARNLLSITNTLVNNHAEDTTSNDTQSETSVTLANNGAIVVGFNDSEENASGGNHFTRVGHSEDGGASFTDSGALGASTNGDAGDPGLAVNKVTGNLYFTTLGFNSSNVIQLFRSTDNGASFQFLSNAAPGFNATHQLDKELIAVDNAAGLGQGTIYVSYTDFGILSTAVYVDRSVNGGVSWTKFKLATGTVQGSITTVGADHSPYVFWLDGNSTSERILVRKGTRSGFLPSRT